MSDSLPLSQLSRCQSLFFPVEDPEHCWRWLVDEVWPSLPPSRRRQALPRLIRWLEHHAPQREDRWLLLVAVVDEGQIEIWQHLWQQRRYALLHRAYLTVHLRCASAPHSDYLLRCFTLLGLLPQVDQHLRRLFSSQAHTLPLSTLSHMLFVALGLEQIDHAQVDALVHCWRDRSLHQAPPCALPRRCLSVSERPALVVASPDLRMHPVGRFWLPMARALAQRFQLIHLALTPEGSDPIRRALQACSAEWHALPSTHPAAIQAWLVQRQPQILLDLGGHTAEALPTLLNQRWAPLQATYLGFYGPSYASECDWWILDRWTAARVGQAYPGSEPVWTLTGAAFCYDLEVHQVPGLDAAVTPTSAGPLLGSLNHSRKLTQRCLHRFAAILRAIPEAVLQIRSHSFSDPQLCRWFMRRLHEAGLAPHQWQPLPYASHAAAAFGDYRRLRLHLDSYPVSGTTTTLDALAMGVPVLTCPNRLYAGAISSALLEQLGLDQLMLCDREEQLPEQALALCHAYRSPAARLSLARQVRASPLFDPVGTPQQFAADIAEMLRAQRL